ncbi:hypothetical protein Z517_08729 [Fonsecaea pedrosoi CBS 271.37]|uniref:Uncharacterized protein n=1 Tax=Fonsecaea pedrosoi CBS 271.37 TaxID=1442368 RepID=A0A0D2GK25_9EURO|nr:uncharacterized protein Z517_08729 [Fonsecaea pedrosoi CBS 271.37]KIW78890.1 hypothetical protein Z517_08729 [Fonsecaea pedrosoi CBS 271.37]
MKSLLLLLSCLVATAAASGPVCSSGVYALLAPLRGYAPAQSYCTSHYPPSTVVTTVTLVSSAPVKAKRHFQTTTTTKTTTKAPSTTTVKPPSTSTTKPPSTTTTRSTSTSVDPKAALFSTLLSEASAIVSTLCSKRSHHLPPPPPPLPLLLLPPPPPPPPQAPFRPLPQVLPPQQPLRQQRRQPPRQALRHPLSAQKISKPAPAVPTVSASMSRQIAPAILASPAVELTAMASVYQQINSAPPRPAPTIHNARFCLTV